ncbi:pyridoxamine 5'-phosphate oxidase family protein [Facklamia miroungae]|uniref:Pyridoxamine 5'-phosphate oxidase n=1 Tax=Facklamia miroungae TaxID=120956 RepID=A0A1G7RSM2_9LACT|nr:pyridoxamine 5'-phosphate oxidase family protein [Facklamia miroungae]NKZ29292.1 pyridoxamine 5'-phosphate oxidase family protein [Facklamia miroungae]SDG13722.1 Pyridoxamine 5'-phosphate oxidase [Facklamia miroungae]
MNVDTIMDILQNDMKVAVLATVDCQNKPHARHVHVGLANDKGVFFMTNPKTNLYQQLQDNQYVAVTAMKEEDYLIQVIRVEGKVRELGKEKLVEILGSNPYVEMVYPDQADREGAQVFQIFEGQGFYHSLTQGHKYEFEIGGNVATINN